MYPQMKIAGAIETHDNPQEAREKSRQFLMQHPGIAGIYVSTANSLPVLEAVDDLDLSGKVTIITTDLFPALAAQIRAGKVAATIYQRPFDQGQIAFKTLYRFLVQRACPPPVIKLAPTIVVKSNLNDFLEQMSLAELVSPAQSMATPEASNATARPDLTSSS